MIEDIESGDKNIFVQKWQARNLKKDTIIPERSVTFGDIFFMNASQQLVLVLAQDYAYRPDVQPRQPIA